MKRIAAFIYGVTCYVIFLATFQYTVGFIGNLFVPKSIDSAPVVPLWQALMTNAVLLGVFAI